MALPVITKNTTQGEKPGFLAFGASTMQGWREEQQDILCTIPSVPQNPKCGFFAVFDGHSPSATNGTAIYASQNLCNNIADSEKFSSGNFVEAFHEGFLKTDNDWRAHPDRDASGSTATVALIVWDQTPPMLYVGNVGDS